MTSLIGSLPSWEQQWSTLQFFCCVKKRGFYETPVILYMSGLKS